MLSVEKRNLVLQRIILIKKLIAIEGSFKGLKFYSLENDHHPYKDYAALLNYLALTCFDIIGQPNEYMPFETWLSVNKKEKYRSIIKERDIIFKRNEGKGSLAMMKAVLGEYNEIYSVKNSFYCFMRERITIANKDKLINSIHFSTNEKIINHADGTPMYSQNIEIIPGTEEKEKFLFKIRNNFTHQGISNSDILGGMIPWVDLNKSTIVSGKEVWPLVTTDFYSIGDKNFPFSVERWPYILIEIIEDAIK